MATIIVLTQTSSSNPITDGSGKEFLGRNLLGEPVFGDVVTNNPPRGSGRTRWDDFVKASPRANRRIAEFFTGLPDPDATTSDGC